MSIRRHKSGCYKITIPIYDRSFYLAFNAKDAKALTKESFDYDDFFGAVREYKNDPPLMVLLEFRTSTIAHECLHLVMIILNRLGSFVDYDNQEPACYLVGYITEQVYKCREMYDLRTGRVEENECKQRG